jgi:hypothetical protein
LKTFPIYFSILIKCSFSPSSIAAARGLLFDPIKSLIPSPVIMTNLSNL